MRKVLKALWAKTIKTLFLLALATLVATAFGFIMLYSSIKSKSFTLTIVAIPLALYNAWTYYSIYQLIIN